MNNIIKVEDDPSLGRDSNTGAIVNLNKDAYLAHIKAKRERDLLTNRLETVEKNVQDIKEMITILLQRSGK